MENTFNNVKTVGSFKISILFTYIERNAVFCISFYICKHVAFIMFLSIILEEVELSQNNRMWGYLYGQIKYYSYTRKAFFAAYATCMGEV